MILPETLRNLLYSRHKSSCLHCGGVVQAPLGDQNSHPNGFSNSFFCLWSQRNKDPRAAFSATAVQLGNDGCRSCRAIRNPEEPFYSLCQLMIRNSNEAIVIDCEKEGTESWIEDYGHLGHLFYVTYLCFQGLLGPSHVDVTSI